MYQPADKDGRAASAQPHAASNGAVLIASCVSGFLIGVLFWDFLGLSLPSYGPEAEVSVSAKIGQGPPTDGSGSRPSCTMLTLDRTTGRTLPSPCEEGSGMVLRNVRSQKEDFGAAPLADASPFAEDSDQMPSYRN